MKQTKARKSIVTLFNSFILTGIVLGLIAFSVMIGMYNYRTSMQDLTSKVSKYASLAAISLREPIWNYDETAVSSVFTAILLDKDVVAIRVLGATDDKTTSEKKREAVEKTDFAELLKDPHHFNNLAEIAKDGKAIARVQIVASSARVRESIRETTMLIAGFSAGFMAILSVFIWGMGKRVLARPIRTLRDSADRLADGDLDQVIQTGRNDELGALAGSFDKMRNAIRKKLADLATLNSAGEKLAGIHDQVLALETAIDVMSRQTNVARGSIYLLDKDGSLKLSAYAPKYDSEVDHMPKSFSMNEGIVGKVAQSGKICFVPDTGHASEFVDNPGSQEGPKSLLCVPMMDDKTIFGVMNFVGEVGQVNFSPDDEGFALTIARTVVITIKNIQMLAVIEEHNRTLEQKILERTAQLHQKTNDVNNMLQNMQQGIFTILPGQVIHPEHSVYLNRIFETDQAANRQVLSLLFEDSDVGSDTISQMSAALDSMIGEDPLMFDLNAHLLIDEYTKYFPNGRSKILELDWNSVMGANDVIDKVMVTVRDVTELKALQKETEKQKEELDIIGQILKVSRDKFGEFLKSSCEFIEENRSLIENHSDKNPDVIAALFRNMHTIKGNARTYGFSYITDAVHETETTYSQMQADETVAWDRALLLEQLDASRACISRYEATFQDKLAGFVDADGDRSRAIIEKIAAELDHVNETVALPALRDTLLEVKLAVNQARSDDIETVLNGVLASIPSLARQLGKEEPVVELGASPVRFKHEIVPVLRNVFMHVFRNSIDHGIEAPEQRTALGKPAAGQIHLGVSAGDDEVTLTYEDDGKGLALERIYNKALAEGVMQADEPVTDEDIAALIFRSGLSTAEVVSTVSGRGVGMDAIKKFLQKYHGDIRLEFTGESTVAGFRPFRQIITLPARFAVRGE